ncbi:MAG: DUF2795 domain-containing protein [Chloroflexota bacterium]
MAVAVSVDDMLKYVQNCNFPTNYQGIMQCARGNNAPAEVMQGLEEMKDATSRVNYNSPGDVKDEIERHRRHISH